MSGRKQAAKAAQAVFQRKDLVMDVSNCVNCHEPLEPGHSPHQSAALREPEGVYRLPLCESCHREFANLPGPKVKAWLSQALGRLMRRVVRERADPQISRVVEH
jgi:hypothetical protein